MFVTVTIICWWDQILIGCFGHLTAWWTLSLDDSVTHHWSHTQNLGIHWCTEWQDISNHSLTENSPATGCSDVRPTSRHPVALNCVNYIRQASDWLLWKCCMIWHSRGCIRKQKSSISNADITAHHWKSTVQSALDELWNYALFLISNNVFQLRMNSRCKKSSNIKYEWRFDCFI